MLSFRLDIRHYIYTYIRHSIKRLVNVIIWRYSVSSLWQLGWLSIQSDEMLDAIIYQIYGNDRKNK